MPATFEPGRMTIAEKLRAMEALWEDLCRDAEASLAPPAWHRRILEARAHAVRRGKDKPVEWETAKKRIRKAVS
ncbi:MAG: addiction module protein [Planctomycetota bacterium]|nr:addiction module protein [Planctomycetota bacterium]